MESKNFETTESSCKHEDNIRMGLTEIKCSVDRIQIIQDGESC